MIFLRPGRPALDFGKRQTATLKLSQTISNCALRRRMEQPTSFVCATRSSHQPSKYMNIIYIPQNHTSDSWYGNPRYPTFGYVGPLRSEPTAAKAEGHFLPGSGIPAHRLVTASTQTQDLSLFLNCGSRCPQMIYSGPYRLRRCMHTYIQTDRQTDRQTDIHTYIHAYTHTCIHACMHACMHDIALHYVTLLALP